MYYVARAIHRYDDEFWVMDLKMTFLLIGIGSVDGLGIDVLGGPSRRSGLFGCVIGLWREFVGSISLSR